MINKIKSKLWFRHTINSWKMESNKTNETFNINTKLRYKKTKRTF